MRFIGIDLGTTSIKGAVLDTEQTTVSGVRQMPFPSAIGGPSGRCEVSPDRIVQTVRCLIDQFLSEVPDCVGMVACGQMHGFVLTDAAGKAASNYISWKDHRSLEPLADASVTGRPGGSLFSNHGVRSLRNCV